MTNIKFKKGWGPPPNKFDMDVDSSNTIDQVKSEIGKRINQPAGSFNLVHRGTVWSDLNKKVADYNVKDGEMVIITPPTVGGCIVVRVIITTRTT